MRRPKLHYLNADFDLSLRRCPQRLERPQMIRQVRELSVQGLVGAAADDAVLVKALLPRDFLDYLSSCDLPVPRLLRHPASDPATRLRPFGWSAEAIELNERHREPAAHPPLSCIRRVNSRSFALELEREWSLEPTRGCLVETLADLESVRAQADVREWIVKAEHGNSGLGNRRLGPGELSPADRRFVEQHLAEDERLVVEPWLPRDRDWCVVFDVPIERSALRVHETVCTADGALIGALFEPVSDGTEPRAELVAAAERVAARLEGEGYFGPVCLDAFSWYDRGRRRLRSLVDLNCRRSMSDGAFRLWRRIAADRTVFYRFFSRRKLRLPATLPRFVEALGERRYRSSAGEGILCLTPLWLDPGRARWQPSKLAVFFIAESRDEVIGLERRFRERFEVSR